MKGNMQEELNLEFEILYKEYYEELFRTAYRLIGNKEDVEDVIQETYLNAFKAFPKFENRSSIGTWIYRIMLNCSYGYMKKKARLPVETITSENGISETDFWESIKSSDSVEESAIIEDIRETCIQLFLICMPKKQRIAFTLKILMQLPSADVANIMDISESAVKVNVYRAKQHLKNNIGGRCSLIDPKNPCQCANWRGYLINTGKICSIPAYNPVKKRSNADISLISSEVGFLSKIISLYDNHPKHTSYEKFIERMKDITSSGTLKILT